MENQLEKLKALALETYEEVKSIKLEIEEYLESQKELFKIIDIYHNQRNLGDKKALAQINNYDLFVIAMSSLNPDDNLTQDLLSNIRLRNTVNSWQYETCHLDIDILINSCNETTYLQKDCSKSFQALGLPNELKKYKIKFVFLIMNSLLEFKCRLKYFEKVAKNISGKERTKFIKKLIEDTQLDNIMDVVYQYKDLTEDSNKNQLNLANQRLTCIEELIAAIDNQSILTYREVIPEWHTYLDPKILPDLYSLINYLISKDYQKLTTEHQELNKVINQNKITALLFAHNINPNLLSPSIKDKINNINQQQAILMISFLNNIGIPLINIITKYYNYLDLFTEEQITKLEFLVENNVLTRGTIIANLASIANNYQHLILNYEILKPIIDFSNAFYNDRILFISNKELQNRISIIKEYNLTKNNYIYLLCHFNNLIIYDLMLENNIPLHLFIAICKSPNPLLTIKKIIICQQIEEPYTTVNQTLSKRIKDLQKFICADEDVDSYLDITNNSSVFDVLETNNITNITEEDIISQFDSSYRYHNDTYRIANLTISRPKFLRKMQAIKNNQLSLEKYIIDALISEAIFSTQDIYYLKKFFVKKKLF